MTRSQPSGPDHAAAGHRILIVDDDAIVCNAIGRVLSSHGFVTTLVNSAFDALERVRHDRFDAVLCDLAMPGMSGVQLIRAVRDIDPDLPFVMLSGINDAVSATSALSEGAIDYILKPAGYEQLADALGRGIRMRTLRGEERRLEALIRREVAHRTAALDAKLSAMRDQTLGIVETLVNAMEAKDVYLRGHSQRVAELAASTAVQIGLDEEAVEQVRMAGRLHEVGKIGISDALLNKPGALTEDEYRQVREYVRLGVEILAPLGFMGPMVQFVAEHHERWNGSGYPAGLAREQISVGARILAVADSFDAVTSRRAFREPMGEAQALDYLETLSGTNFDPGIFQAFRMVMERRKALLFLDVHEPLARAG